MEVNTRKNTSFSTTTTNVNQNYKHDYPILEYQEKFKLLYSNMKSSLHNTNANITNYKHEIAKLEEFLITINEHENNYKILTKKYKGLKNIMEETVEIEKLIGKLSSNQ